MVTDVVTDLEGRRTLAAEWKKKATAMLEVYLRAERDRAAARENRRVKRREYAECAEEASTRHGEMGGEGVFAGAEVQQVYVTGKGEEKEELWGWLKVLRTRRELFVEELHVAEERRGRYMSYHLLQGMVRATGASGGERVRLQVEEGNGRARHTYEEAGFEVLGGEGPGGAQEGEEAEEGHVMMATSVGEMMKKVGGKVVERPVDGKEGMPNCHNQTETRTVPAR